jgi:hypothetical protein
MKSVRFAGVALGGGKTDKTAVAILEYYPEQKRIFLRSLRDKIKSEGKASADLKLHQLLTEEETDLHSIAFDVPLQLPKCMRCKLKCPGYEDCKVPEIKWLWQKHELRGKTKKPNKIFTPYTERCAETYIANELEEPFHPSHAMGANSAPLLARAHFISRRLHTPVIEVYPKLSLWRIGRELKVAKSHLRYHKHAIEGDESRLVFLQALMNASVTFIYQQDLRLMVENNSAFEAFLSALTAFLKYRGQCEKRPDGFPKAEAWIEFPKESFHWF